jgi:hypothetical protein
MMGGSTRRDTMMSGSTNCGTLTLLSGADAQAKQYQQREHAGMFHFLVLYLVDGASGQVDLLPGVL